MRILKRALQSAMWGAAGGVALAIFWMTLDEMRPFPVSWSGFIDRATFRLCPLYILGFSSNVKSMTELVLITMAGNAILYGVLTALLFGTVALLRRGCS
ncbi:MAG TPA: hypothetical protein VGR47_19685 [Terracidiphilus sp.]|nr:hypothetical protein [Terracidiphilus sp.]